MSSWLGGLGTGLGQSLGQVGGSLSSFTGQISTFTKDMLLEGMEEVGDAATELQLSNSKLAEFETAFASQKSEYDRLRKLHAELEEKLEASEIQIKQQSAEYRSLLQQKDVEISHLKARQSGLQEEVQKLQHSAQSSSIGPAVLPIVTTSSTTTSSSASGSHQGFHSHEVDISDVLWSQQEINRLSTEVNRMEGELAHWKRMSQVSAATGVGNGDQGEIFKLQRTIKELRDEMSREVDEHQHELAALQDAQRQKMADVTRRHREELAEYEERIEELEDQIQSGDNQASASLDSSELQRSTQEAAEQLAELKALLEDAQSERASLQQERDDAVEENAELLQNYARLQASVVELQTRVQEQQEKALVKAQLEHEIQALRSSLAAAEKENERLKSLSDAGLKEEVEHADILELNTIIGTLRQEKEILEQEKFDLQERLKASEAESDEMESTEDLRAELERKEKVVRAAEEERDALMSELEELDRQNQEATQHVISVKEELSGQLKEAQAELSRVTLELDAAKEQNKTLEEELKSQKETIAQSAFTLTDLQTREQEQSRDAGGEVAELRRALEETRSSYERAKSEEHRTKTENGKLREEAEELSEQLKESRAALNRTITEKDARIEASELEKQQLEAELSQAERSLTGKVERYRQTIEELNRARSTDATALRSELETAIRLNQTKELELAKLRRDLEQLASDHRDANEMLSITVAGQKQLTDLLQEKDAFAETLKRNAADLQAEMESNLAVTRREAEALKRSLEDKEKQLGGMKEENSHLKEEMDRVQQSRPSPPAEPKSPDVIAEMEAEITQLKSEEERRASLLRRAADQGEDKSETPSPESGNEKHDLSKSEIERLVKGIEEKEAELGRLNESNLSLTRQLEQLLASRDEASKLSQTILQKDVEIQALRARVSAGGGQSQDVLFLQQQLQAYAAEREQMLAVLNEKTRENGQLRSDYHRLVDIVSGKEAALAKLQQENQRLSNAADPSGSQEMFKETIQNLSRIIREKDIEIDALTQKCQTLVTVLQSAGGESAPGGVSSNQFEELLQERDALKQQVKKMEEWKQQVITTVKNTQHESAQLHEELVKLRGQVSADSDRGSELSADYARLIRSYEQKEKRLGSLSQELARVQQTITQLSSTKDVLLGRLDDAAQTQEASPGNERELLGELQRLRAQLSDKENTVRTLQENNHRLANSASAEEARQIRERMETLQRSLREKDLLIKSKGDQLLRASESLRNRESDNEVLKQAATNLKERALILELDAKKLKEENELVAARSREKESEFRALQETNMQFSLLLKEKEFELSAMSEKAATVEKLLKDKEQGKSGELNQLLNELKSMQDKAVMFQLERDQMMMALKQKQMETTAVQAELQHVRDKEQRLNLELERLRNHLLEIEDSYTREALAAEDRETELRRRVATLDDKLASSSNAVEKSSQQASMQVESLQEQLGVVMKQRDDAHIQLRTSQEQVNQYAVSLSNLQMVLEQFQQEEKAMYSAELEKHKREKAEWRRKALTLEDQASALQMNLDEANAALDSASRLTDQLDLKEEQIEELKKQMNVRQEMLDEAQKKLMNLMNSTEGKIDKVLMRNLFLGYFHTPKTKRSDVLRLMGSVLGLSRDDVDKMLEEDRRPGVTGWMSSWLGSRGAQSVPNTPQKPTSGHDLNSSFSEMFVKFLETESTPSLPPPKLPVHDIKPLSAPPSRRTSAPGSTNTGAPAGGRRLGESNPFLAPRSAAVPLPAGSGSSGSGGHLLMKPISDALPTFTPVPVSAEASAGAVLKDLLKQ